MEDEFFEGEHTRRRAMTGWLRGRGRWGEEKASGAGVSASRCRRIGRGRR
jgi:hypothetical protein